MSTQRKPDYIEDELSEQAVQDYLEAHPDFFENNAALLSSLRVPHGSGAAVSLVERQVSVLRQKELKLERQLKELISVARDNDVLDRVVRGDVFQGVGSRNEQIRSFSDLDRSDPVREGEELRVVDSGGTKQPGWTHPGRYPALHFESSVETRWIRECRVAGCVATEQQMSTVLREVAEDGGHAGDRRGVQLFPASFGN